MGTVEPLRQDIIELVSRNFGKDVGEFFSSAYEEDTLPIFLNHSYTILKELMGENKAREQLDIVLNRYNMFQKYE